MSALGLAATLIVPLGLATAMVVAPLRRSATQLAPWAAAPGLVLASGLLGGSAVVEVRWALFGMRLDGADPLARGFLAFTALVWFFASWFARTYVASSPHRTSFWLFFLLTMSGNLGVVVAGDVASFYLFYALMTFAAYGLVVHERTSDARRAARVYLAMALAGEMLLLAAFFLVIQERINLPLREVPAAVASSPRRDLIVGLVLAGFGVKAGALPLHVWLPLAHPVAPSPASAVLSATIIKAGLLGWLRFLPLGVVALPVHGVTCAALGMLGAFYASAVGVTQTDPKTVLAYSSVSQMGFMMTALGVGLFEPVAAEAAQAAIVLFALHHAVAKGSLFMGAAVAKTTGPGWPGRLVTLGLLFPALAIAGAPLSSGAIAKVALKEVVKRAPFGSSALGAVLSLAAIGSALLMIRFLLLAMPRRGAAARTPRPGLWVPWTLLLAAGATVVVHRAHQDRLLHVLVEPGALWSAAWPVGAGVGIASLAAYAAQRGALEMPEIPPGDILAFAGSAAARGGPAVASTARRARRAKRRALVWAQRHVWFDRRGPRLAFVDRSERRLRGFGAVGAVMLLLLAILMPLLLR